MERGGRTFAPRAPGGTHRNGQKFADNAETLILIATSHFEPDEKAYGRLLEKVRTLSPAHRTNVALAHAVSHLRFGFEAFYGRSLTKMRDDNGPDYPALCFALAVLMEAYARMHDDGVAGTERDRIVEGVLNGLTPDAAAFIGDPPPSLSAHEAERSRFRELFLKYRRDLLEKFEGHRPSEQAYSPISFFFNFSHNVLKATVVDALLRRKGWATTLNDLLSGIPRTSPWQRRGKLWPRRSWAMRVPAPSGYAAAACPSSFTIPAQVSRLSPGLFTKSKSRSRGKVPARPREHLAF